MSKWLGGDVRIDHEFFWWSEFDVPKRSPLRDYDDGGSDE